MRASSCANFSHAHLPMHLPLCLWSLCFSCYETSPIHTTCSYTHFCEVTDDLEVSSYAENQMSLMYFMLGISRRQQKLLSDPEENTWFLFSVPRAQSSPSWWLPVLLQTLNSYLGLLASVLTDGSFAGSDPCCPGANCACVRSGNCFPLYMVSSYTLNSSSFVS